MIDRAQFAEQFNVSRETLVKLDRYATLLKDWQNRMNLVGPSTIETLWARHFADSAQLLPLANPGSHWLDIGAGAGFPGTVIAILDPDARVTLVESIAKKCRFLETVVEELQLRDRVRIENRRIESLPAQRFDVVTARALASLRQIFAWTQPFADCETRWILPKGARWADEIAEAQRRYIFEYTCFSSVTDDSARIIVTHNVAPR